MSVSRSGRARQADVTRRLTPAVFLLGLVLFLVLPAAAASCDVPPAGNDPGGRIAISYSGADLAKGAGDLEAGGPPLSPAQRARATAEFGMPLSVRVLTVLGAAVMLAGVGTVLLRRAGGRVVAVVALGLAGAAAVVLAVGEYLALARLTDQARFLLQLGVYLPQVHGRHLDDRVGEVVHTRPGFWLALACLLLAGIANALLLRRGDGDRRAGHP